MAIIDEIRVSHFRDGKEEKDPTEDTKIVSERLYSALKAVDHLNDLLDDVTSSLSSIADFVKRPSSTKRDTVHLLKSLENQINNRRGY